MSKKIALIRGCTGCDTCRWLCPQQAISFDHQGAHANPEKCIGCEICADNCQSFAIIFQEIKSNWKEFENEL